MVHLGQIPTDKQISDKDNVTVGVKELNIDGDQFGAPGQDEFTSSVYGSRFASTDLPKHEMPDDEMPREIAYRMIKYALTLVSSFPPTSTLTCSTGTI